MPTQSRGRNQTRNVSLPLLPSTRKPTLGELFSQSSGVLPGCVRVTLQPSGRTFFTASANLVGSGFRSTFCAKEEAARSKAISSGATHRLAGVPREEIVNMKTAPSFEDLVGACRRLISENASAAASTAALARIHFL